MLCRVTYAYPNFNSRTVEVWEWISNFISHFIMGGVTKIGPEVPSSWRSWHYHGAVDSTIHDDVIKWKLFSALLAISRGIHRSPMNSPREGQWRGALMFFYLRLNKRFSKQWWCWWFETPSRPLWLQCNAGRTCQRWDSQSPYRHHLKNTIRFAYFSLRDAENYCRNPT